MTAERRVVTILFSDVTGSTAAASQLDPEDWSEIVNEIFACLIAPVDRYGGTVARLMGDAILAFFGAPDAHEDDPQRAVMAGLEIVEGIQPLQQRVKSENGVDFDIRVGINTDVVVVGEFGARGQLEYTAMGDGINVAARMEQTAQPGTVQIAHATYQLIAPMFDVEPLGDIEIKGKDKPEPAYRVRGLLAGRGRRRNRATLRAELVGREHQMATLETAVAQLRQGRGQIVCLIGEAGLGKSRLVSELHNRWSVDADPERDLWVDAEALSYDSGQPYLLFRQLVLGLAGVMDRDPPDLITTKIQELVNGLALANPERSSSALVGMVTGTGREARVQDELRPAQLTGEAVKRELFAAVTDLWRAATRSRSAVLVFEDLHWADSASIELLQHLLPLTDQAPILFLCTLRPGHQSPAWQLKLAAETDYLHRYTQILLEPLATSDMTKLTVSLLSNPALSAELEGLVLDRADGNPLFVEEIVRSLIDQGVLVRGSEQEAGGWLESPDASLAEITIPNSLRALLLERIDRLDANTRRTLQMASVIGRTVSRRLLEAVHESHEDLDVHLAALLRMGLIRESAYFPDREYQFHHALIWEVAYRTALRRQRRDDHRVVAEALEHLYGDRLDEYAAILGHHFAEAEEPRAKQYFTMAGDAAWGLYANHEALNHYRQALNLPGDDQNHYLHLRCGVIYARLGEFDDARNHLEAARDLSHERHDVISEQTVLYELAGLYTSRDYTIAEQFASEALNLARQQPDRRVEGRALNRLGNIEANGLGFANALAFHQRALEVFEDLGDQWGIADSLDFIGISHVMAGNLFQAEDALLRAIDIFAEIGDRQRLASAINSLGIISEVGTGGPSSFRHPRAWYQEHIQRGLELSRQIEWRPGEVFALIALSNTSLGSGNIDAALEHARTALAKAREFQHAQWELFARFTLGRIFVEVLDDERALEQFEQGEQITDTTAFLQWQERIRAFIGRCLWRLGDTDRSIALLQSLIPEHGAASTIGQQRSTFTLAEIALWRGEPGQALAMIERLSIEPSAVPTAVLLLRGRTLAALGNRDEAAEQLERARQAAISVGPRTFSWSIAAARADLLQELDATKAQQEREHMRQEIEMIAATISDSDTRARFVERAMAEGRAHEAITDRAS